MERQASSLVPQVCGGDLSVHYGCSVLRGTSTTELKIEIGTPLRPQLPLVAHPRPQPPLGSWGWGCGPSAQPWHWNSSMLSSPRGWPASSERAWQAIPLAVPSPLAPPSQAPPGTPWARRSLSQALSSEASQSPPMARWSSNLTGRPGPRQAPCSNMHWICLLAWPLLPVANASSGPG